jgi:SnoaL-like polyketide cyclase
MAMDPFVAVMRRYVVDYLQCQNAEVCAQIMEPDYVLYMGGTELTPRDEVYVPAVVRQLQQFPGLGMTVNEIMCNGDRLAMRFSQHGASTKHDGRMASWGGIGLYRWNGVKLTSNYAIEDYYSRRYQLVSGVALPVESPAIAPWDTVAEAADPTAEQVVRDWLESAGSPKTAGIAFDDEAVGTSDPLVDVHETVIDDLFSVGDRVAFHATQTGTYVGGLDVPDTAVGRPATLYSVGVLGVDGDLISGRVIRERAALQRELSR